ncbi:type III secretion protein [Rhizobium leguminosarum bv. trifolii]|uniref:Type III secretion protein n=1 Tax=Rhizobium leguminosarum bv. trifolii TaxID=386 RepID=A0A3E1B6Q6_RHILT|nr:FliM/FliN family flagellar motor switch protein [Rhizobium leguminosarum]RFB86360.1 type III secretion protein [Rhizobium leguminosarum bv. trifolii]RFB86618.1 type III secretion protein [Rhizobium leguminosarum bv. trifolii]
MNVAAPAWPHASMAGNFFSSSGTMMRAAWQIPVREQTLSVRPLAPDIAAARTTDPVGILCRVGEREQMLIASAGALRLLAERLEPLLLWEKLSPSEKAAVVEHLFAEAFEAIENRISMSLSLLQIGAETQPDVSGNFGFDIGWNGMSLPLSGRFDETALAGLVGWASRLPRRTLNVLTTAVSIRRGYAVLSVSEIKSLRLGDGIVIDGGAPETVVAITGERYLATCMRSDKGAVLTGPLLSTPTGPMRHFMTNETVDQELQGEPRPSPVDSIPIKLVFDAGRLELPLRTLEMIGEGYVFNLDRPLSDAVDIIAQGRVIGRGEIISVDGLSAVRVTALHD